MFFLQSLSCKLYDQTESMFTDVLFYAVCWDTPSEKTGLWQLPIVFSAFKATLSHSFNLAGKYLFRSFVHFTLTRLSQSDSAKGNRGDTLSSGNKYRMDVRVEKHSIALYCMAKHGLYVELLTVVLCYYHRAVWLLPKLL